MLCMIKVSSEIGQTSQVTMNQLHQLSATGGAEEETEAGQEGTLLLLKGQHNRIKFCIIL